MRAEVAIGITEMCKNYVADARSGRTSDGESGERVKVESEGILEGERSGEDVDNVKGSSRSPGTTSSTKSSSTSRAKELSISTSSELSRLLLRIMLDTLPLASSREYNRNSEQFFRLVCVLVRMQKRRSKEFVNGKARPGAEARQWDQRDFTLLLRKCLATLRSHQSLEVFNQLPLYSLMKEFGSTEDKAIAPATATTLPAIAKTGATTTGMLTTPGQSQIQDHVLFGTLQMIRVIVRVCPESLFPALSAGSGSVTQGKLDEDEEKKSDELEKGETEEKVASIYRQPRARRSNSSSTEAGVELINYILCACNFRGLLELKSRDQEGASLKKLGPKCTHRRTRQAAYSLVLDLCRVCIRRAIGQPGAMPTAVLKIITQLCCSVGKFALPGRERTRKSVFGDCRLESAKLPVPDSRRMTNETNPHSQREKLRSVGLCSDGSHANQTIRWTPEPGLHVLHELLHSAPVHARELSQWHLDVIGEWSPSPTWPCTT